MIAFIAMCKKCPHLHKIQVKSDKFDNHWHCGKSNDPRQEIVAFETAKGVENRAMIPPADCPSLLDHIMASEELKEIMGNEVVAYSTCRIAANQTLPLPR